MLNANIPSRLVTINLSDLDDACYDAWLTFSIELINFRHRCYLVALDGAAKDTVAEPQTIPLGQLHRVA